MRIALFIFVAAALSLAGCKQSGWVWNVSDETIQAVDGPPEEAASDKEIIFVLGVDGMD